MLAAPDDPVHSLGTPRWRGQPGRVEVWYCTATDLDGTGYWLHYETVGPTDRDAYGHGWAARFPVDAPPEVEQFGPHPADTELGGWFQTGSTSIGPGRMRGSTASMSWDLTFDTDAPPIWTFPRQAWECELLPGAQIVPWPNARVRGTFTASGEHELHAIGAVSRTYGHGNAERWCWLHADLGDGESVEVVAGTPRRRGLRRLPMVTMVQLRTAGHRDWPAHQLAASAGVRTRRTPTGFTVSGTLGGRRLRIQVSLPPDRCVALTYTDPDGSTAVCTNCERANADVVVERWRGRWMIDRRWTLTGTAHAEFGVREPFSGPGSRGGRPGAA